MLSDRPPEVLEGISWDQFMVALKRGSRRPFCRAWQPGDHVALVGPTGEGKTTVAVGLLNLRKWVIALDPKGGDRTLSATGWPRLTSLPPPRKIRQDIAEGKPAHLIIGGPARSEREDRALTRLLGEALDYARHSEGYTVYADEFQLLADARMFGLGKPVERMLISARDAGTSIVTSFQAQAWVPRAAVRQATAFVAMFPTRDRDMIEATARGMGRDPRQVAHIMDQLPEFHCVIIPKKVHDPMLMTSAHELRRAA
jgi:hypothetical protein